VDSIIGSCINQDGYIVLRVSRIKGRLIRVLYRPWGLWECPGAQDHPDRTYMPDGDLIDSIPVCWIVSTSSSQVSYPTPCRT